MERAILQSLCPSTKFQLTIKTTEGEKEFHAQLNNEAGEAVKSKSFKTMRLAISWMVRVGEEQQEQAPSVQGMAEQIAAT